MRSWRAYLRLAPEGHEVRVAIQEVEAQGTLAGLGAHRELARGNLLDPGCRDDGVVIFETVSDGLGPCRMSCEEGGSAFGGRLENDRAFAQEVLTDLGS